MGEKESFLLSPEWWISVVIVGLLINFIAAYTKPVIDTWVARRSDTKKLELEKQKNEEQLIVNDMVANPSNAIELRIERTRSSLKLILYIVVAIVARDMALLVFGKIPYLLNFNFYIPRESGDLLMVFVYFILLIKGVREINFMRKLSKLIIGYDKKVNKAWLN